MMGDANAAGATLPDYLQLNQSLLSPEERKKYEQFYKQQYVDPSVENAKSELFSQGRSNSTFGGAVLGQAIAQGDYQTMMAGNELQNQRLGNLLNMRSSFGGLEGNMATTAAGINSGFKNTQASLLAQDSANKNNFNQGVWAAGLQNNLGKAQQAWSRQTDLWNRDNDLYNRAFSERQFNAQENANRTQAVAAGGEKFGRGLF